MNDQAKELSKYLLAKDAETDFRIEYGTEMYARALDTCN